MTVKVQQEINKPEEIRKIKITTKPRNGIQEIGDINIVKKAFPDIIEAMKGRSKAFFIASYLNGKLKIYSEVKPKEEW